MSSPRVTAVLSTRSLVLARGVLEGFSSWDGMVFVGWDRFHGMGSDYWDGIIVVGWDNFRGTGSSSWDGMVFVGWDRLRGMI